MVSPLLPPVHPLMEAEFCTNHRSQATTISAETRRDMAVFSAIACRAAWAMIVWISIAGDGGDDIARYHAPGAAPGRRGLAWRSIDRARGVSRAAAAHHGRLRGRRHGRHDR